MDTGKRLSTTDAQSWMAASLQTGSERGSRDDVTNDMNMKNRLDIFNEKFMAARLERAIEGGSADDVRAAIKKGAHVNSLYTVKLTYFL